MLKVECSTENQSFARSGDETHHRFLDCLFAVISEFVVPALFTLNHGVFILCRANISPGFCCKLQRHEPHADQVVRSYQILRQPPGFKTFMPTFLQAKCHIRQARPCILSTSSNDVPVMLKRWLHAKPVWIIQLAEYLSIALASSLFPNIIEWHWGINFLLWCALAKEVSGNPRWGLPTRPPCVCACSQRPHRNGKGPDVKPRSNNRCCFLFSQDLFGCRGIGHRS